MDRGCVEQPGEGGQAARDPRAGGLLADPEALRDVGVGQLVDDAHPHCVADGGRELGKRGRELGAQRDEPGAALDLREQPRIGGRALELQAIERAPLGPEVERDLGVGRAPREEEQQRLAVGRVERLDIDCRARHRLAQLHDVGRCDTTGPMTSCDGRARSSSVRNLVASNARGPVTGGQGIVEGLRAGFATPDLRRLQFGWSAASVGGWAFMVALSVHAYGEGGALAVGLAALVRMLPAGLAAPLAGLLADRHSRRDVLVVSCAGRAVALAALAVAVAAGAALALVLAIAAAVTVLQTGHRPAQAALLPRLARTPRELAAANAVWSALDSAGFLVGALLGGALIAAAGTAAVFTVTAALLLAAAAVLARIERDAVPEHRAELSGWGEIAGGLRAVRGDPALALVAGVVAVTTLVEGAVDVLVVVAALSLLDLGDAGVGWLNGAWGAGGLAGGLAALMLLHRGRLSAGLAGGAAAAGIALALLAAAPSVAAGVALFAVFGAGYALVEIAGLTLAQRLASDEQLARAFGLMESAYWITTAAGAILAPLLIAGLGVRGALAAAGGCLVVLVAASARALARLEHGTPVPERGLALLRGVGFLAPVPLATLENLAVRLTAVNVAAGADAVREGDRGAHFYVVDSGVLDVHAGGRALGRLGPGDHFGEIALLRGVPRTATVTAAGQARLQSLGREEFLAAMTSQPRAAQAAERFAAARRRATGRSEDAVHAG